MKKESRRTSKYLLLALILVAVFVLPGCRTRLTNNSEVSNIQYDEDGYMSDMYQMRRDELGLSTAERPLLPDFGSGETDENDDFGEGEEINYNPEDYQEDFSEPQTNTNTNTNTNTGTRTRTNPTNTPSRSTPSRRPSTSSYYNIIFDANGGKFGDGGEKYNANVPKGDKIGKHFPSPNPTRKGYKFVEWRVKAGNAEGEKVSPDMVATKGTTFLAHWEVDKPAPQPTKYYIVTLFQEGKKTEEKVEEGKTFTLPPLPSKPGYNPSWNTSEDGSGTKYSPGSTISSKITVYARWDDKKEPEVYWEEIFEETKKTKKDDSVNCYIIGSEKEKKLITACVAESVDIEDSPTYVFLFVEDVEAPTEEEKAKIPEGAQNVYYVDKDAINDSNSLVNKMAIMNILHVTDLPVDDAASELEGTILVKVKES